MADLLHSLSDRLHVHRAQSKERMRPTRAFSCRCGNPVFFTNSRCLPCNSVLGYLPDEGKVVTLDPGPRPGTWTAEGRDEVLAFCANYDSPAGCNWLTNADTSSPFCISCRLNRTIPNLSEPENAGYWAELESAKRRMVSQLIGFGLPVRSKWEDPGSGAFFDFLRSEPGGPQVMTGHASGVITVNAEEADDARREQIRHAMHEPYRTLLGHFRHEIGHYYWDRLIWGTKWLQPYRELFGDERASYAEALKRNYEQGPPPDWPLSYVSSYATMHPWEDWAETWAHYMHIMDTVETALSFGLSADDTECPIVPFGKDALHAPDDADTDQFLHMLNGWLEVTIVLNELSRSMGEPEFYPFVLSKPAVAKLQFVQRVVSDACPDMEL
jgi:hypothetical protein